MITESLILKDTDIILDVKSKDYISFWKEEKRKCIEGVTIDGIFIPGRLYFYINYSTIEIDHVVGKSSYKTRGRPFLRDIDWEIFNKVEEAERAQKGIILYTARGAGKDLHEDTVVYKEEGEVPIKDLSEGDFIYGADGRLTKVLKLMKYYDQMQYRVLLSDGREIVAGEGHLWSVNYKNKGERIVDTKYLYERHLEGRRKDRVLFIPMQKAIEYSRKQLILDPYTLGALIGDGGMTTSNIILTTADKEVLDNIPFPVVRYKQKYTYCVKNIRDIIKELGLHGKKSEHKFIPKEYLYSSVEQRMALLQGLMDTDGCAGKHGIVEYNTSSPQLAIDFNKLLRGLGIRFSVVKKKTTHLPTYRFKLRTGEPVFRLKRKLDKLITSPSNWTLSGRTEVSIKEVHKLEVMPSVCIEIDNDSKLFQAGPNIVTHNSFSCAALAAHTYTFFSDSETIISSEESSHINRLMQKVNMSLSGLPLPFTRQRLSDDLTKEIRSGWKNKKTGKREGTNSRILAINYKNNTMAANGTRPKLHIFEEIGTMKYLKKDYSDSIHCWRNDFGQFAIPVLVGCVCAGTKVWTSNGNMVNIEDLQQEQGILGFDMVSKENSENTITYMQTPFEKECYRITTKLGRVLECSEDHPILCRFRNKRERLGNRPSKYGNGPRKTNRLVSFIEASRLEVGNQVAIMKEYELKGKKHMWEPRLIGWLIGDGSYGIDHSPRMSSCDIEINSHLESNFDAKFLRGYLTKEGKEYKEIRLKGVCGRLRELGIYGQTKLNKRLPTDLHLYKKEDICELIGGLFDTDGCAHIGKVNYSVSITSSVFELLTEVRMILQRLNIHSSIVKKEPSIKEGRLDKNPWYLLSISSAESIRNFYKNIQFKVKYKQEKLELIVAKIADKKGKRTQKEHNNLVFETIKKVEYIGKKLVYNLTANETNTYIANGIVTHNTGGDTFAGADAEEMFNEPEAYNLLSITDVWETGKQIGLFIPATKTKNQHKESKSIAEYLEVSNPSELLSNTQILVSNEVLAKEYFEKERASKKKATDPMTYLKEVMYNPFVPSEVLLRSGGSRFNIDQLKQQLHAVETKYNDLGLSVSINSDPTTGKLKASPSSKKQIKNFPLKPGEDKEGTIIIYESPPDTIPYGMYIAGIDPYDQNYAPSSTSLGACYIYKKFNGFGESGMSREIVAEYVGRPQLASTFYENCLNLLRYYNAVALCENANTGIFTYFYNKHYEYLLADTPELVRNILPDSVVGRVKGLHPAPKIINHGLTLVKEYLEEEILKEFDEKGNVVRVYNGVSRIKSIGLLKELIAYNDDDAKGNYDKVVALYHVLMYEEETALRQYNQEEEKRDTISFFGDTKHLFRKKKRRI